MVDSRGKGRFLLKCAAAVSVVSCSSVNGGIALPIDAGDSGATDGAPNDGAISDHFIPGTAVLPPDGGGMGTGDMGGTVALPPDAGDGG
jgi:hypothetical protein